MDKALEREVRERAGARCEYCHFPEALSELRHVIDHIVARQHAGETVRQNLALACGRCNRHKGPNLTGIDPVSGELAPLFNPRSDRWIDHFRWDGVRLVGLTAVGRATVEVLAINQPYSLARRRVLVGLGKLRLD